MSQKEIAFNTSIQDHDLHEWRMICHASSLIMLIGIPYGNLIGPYIVWRLKRDEYGEIDTEAKDLLNFQILISMITTFLFICIIALEVLITLFNMLPSTQILFAIPIFTLILMILLIDVFFVVRQCIAIHENRQFQPYPLLYRFVK